MSKNYRAGGTEGRPKGRDEWRTPPDLYQELDREFRFALDVACTTSNCLSPLGIYRDLGQNAFEQTWGPGWNWMNPPYSGQGGVRPWLERAAEMRSTVCLVSADTSTRWWLEVVQQLASEVRFVVGRLRFLPPDSDTHHYTKRKGGGLTTPSAIVVFGSRVGRPGHHYILRNGRPAKESLPVLHS